MSIFNINLDLEENYIHLIKDLYKIIIILIIFQILIYYSNSQKNIINTALMGSILNDDFMTLLIYIIIGISGYYLVFDKIISIN